MFYFVWPILNNILVADTLRSNLDPFSIHDDATLWDALKRSYLVESSTSSSRKNTGEKAAEGEKAPANKYNLDTVIEAGGNNLSVGQVGLPLP